MQREIAEIKDGFDFMSEFYQERSWGIDAEQYLTKFLDYLEDYSILENSEDIVSTFEVLFTHLQTVAEKDFIVFKKEELRKHLMIYLLDATYFDEITAEQLWQIGEFLNMNPEDWAWIIDNAFEDMDIGPYYFLPSFFKSLLWLGKKAGIEVSLARPKIGYAVRKTLEMLSERYGDDWSEASPLGDDHDFLRLRDQGCNNKQQYLKQIKSVKL